MRQCDDKVASVAGFGVEGDGAVVSFDDGLGNCEAEAGPAGVP
jgi:hypothetical protein